MLRRLCLKKKLFYMIITLIPSLIIIINYPSLVSYFPDAFVLVSYSNRTDFNRTDFNRTDFNRTDFKQQLLDKRLFSYNVRYNDSLPVCDKTGNLSENQQRDFPKISNLLQTFRKQIVSYPDHYFNGRGIVFTAGIRQWWFAKVNLKMIALTGTRLPVQIWYSSTQLSVRQMTNLLAAAPNVNASACCFHTGKCRSLTKVWQLNTSHIYKPKLFGLSKPFPYKPAAIISATFAEVLFLDCDAYVTRDPEELFLSDPMYLKFGALFFPDALKSRQHPAVWNLFNTSCADDEYEFDSATILVDKRKVWNGLYLAKLMNDDHHLFYKYVTDGDKDTFRLAFRYMQVKYYLVMTPCATGTYDGNYFCGQALCKTDSLSQHVYINHMHLFKYNDWGYSPKNLGYTRIGLGDPSNNSFYFDFCRASPATIHCFHILKEPNEQANRDKCYRGSIPVEEIEDYQYASDESLTTAESENERVIITKTNNLMPNFVENFLQSTRNIPQ